MNIISFHLSPTVLHLMLSEVKRGEKLIETRKKLFLPLCTTNYINNMLRILVTSRDNREVKKS